MLAAICGNIGAVQREWDAHLPECPCHELGVGVRFGAAQFVVQVGAMQFQPEVVAKSLQSVKKRHRVGAAGHGDQQPLA